MLRNVSNLLSLLSFLAFVGSTQVVNAQAPAYPATKKGDVVDDYHGTKVADPYRWLEDLGSADTKAWIDAENAVTLPYLEKLPQRRRAGRTPDPALELPADEPSAARGRPDLLPAEHRTAEAGAAVSARLADRAGATAARPEHAVRRRQHLARAMAALARRALPRLRAVAGRRRLGRRARARDRDGQGPPRRRPLVPLLRHLVDQGQQGLLLCALPGAAAGQGARGRPQGPSGLVPPRRERRRTRTG